MCVSTIPDWRGQAIFAPLIGDEFRPLFLQRLKDSLANWDMRDGKADWTPPALAANAYTFFDDFLMFGVTMPINDTRHLEIEKSTLNGKAYGTGGGRTVDADVIDVLLTWMVNRDREPPGRRNSFCSSSSSVMSGASGHVRPADRTRRRIS
jgi:hypothetical protein